MQDDFSLINKTSVTLPRLPLEQIKNDILGKTYSLSIAFVSPSQSKTLNKKYRDKNNATNVLSFTLHKDAGELVLCPQIIKREAKEKKFDKDFTDLTLFLVIHGMLHLKGLEHSSTMERAEEKYCKKYDQKHFNRNRRGLVYDKSRSGRIRKGRKKS